MIYCRLD